MLTAIWKFLTCCRHKLVFVRNIYGDEIIHTGAFKRSWWKCSECGALKSKEHLHIDPETGEPA